MRERSPASQNCPMCRAPFHQPSEEHMAADDEIMSISSLELSLVSGSPWILLINIPKGRLHDVIYCYNLGKICLPVYLFGLGLLMSVPLAQRKR